MLMCRRAGGGNEAWVLGSIGGGGRGRGGVMRVVGALGL